VISLSARSRERRIGHLARASRHDLVWVEFPRPQAAYGHVSHVARDELIDGHNLRPSSARLAAIGGGRLVAAWAWFAAYDDGPLGLVRQSPAIVLVSALASSLLVRPSVGVGRAGVMLHNVCPAARAIGGGTEPSRVLCSRG